MKAKKYAFGGPEVTLDHAPGLLQAIEVAQAPAYTTSGTRLGRPSASANKSSWAISNLQICVGLNGDEASTICA